MLQDRQVCRFPGCDKGTDGKAYVTLDDMEDQNLITMDMRLHTRVHLAGISAVTESEAMVYKGEVKRTLQSGFRTENVSRRT